MNALKKGLTVLPSFCGVTALYKAGQPPDLLIPGLFDISTFRHFVLSSFCLFVFLSFRPFVIKKRAGDQNALPGKQTPARNKSRSRKEVFQPHLPVRLPCYDLAPVIRFTLGGSFRSPTSGTPDFHGLTGGVYKARERIHRIMADIRLLANPASRSRVADSDPNLGRLSGLAKCHHPAALCTYHCSTCVALDVRAVLT